MTVAFRTFGCKLNQAETAMIRQDFINQGYIVVPWGKGADVSVLNSCTVTGRSDSKCRQAIRKTLKLNPKTTMIVVGCYSQASVQEVSRLSGVDYIFGVKEKLEIFDYFPGPGKQQEPLIVVSDIHNQKHIVQHNPGDYQDQTRAFLKIQNGCNRNCSYCIVPVARGPARSVPEEKVISDFKTLVDQGFQEIVLTGVHIGDYGKDRHNQFGLYHLLDQLLNHANNVRVRLSSLDPYDINDELVSCLVNYPQICRHFHLTLQSGSNRILKSMNRSYTREFFREKVQFILSNLGEVGLGADVIVGFPGETEELFRETYIFLKELPLSYFHVFPFSARKGTKAATMVGQILPRIRLERAKRLRLLGEQKKTIFKKHWLNHDVQVLLENRNVNGWIRGLSSQYLRVEVPYDGHLKNRIVPVRIEKLSEIGVRGHVLS